MAGHQAGDRAGQPAGGGHDGGADRGHDDDSHELAEALKRHPSLANHRQALAFVAEKLEQQGGGDEATGEIVNGPNQETYDDRAYPREAIGAQQQQAAAQSYRRALARSVTAQGRRVLSQTIGSAEATARRWQPLGPRGGVQVGKATYTGTPATVSGRATSLAIGKHCTPAHCVLWAGTAGGGVWRTARALAPAPRWRPIGEKSIPSTAIGVVYQAPRGGLYVGTGEPNGSSDSEAGVGLYRSANGLTGFRRVPTIAGGVDFTIGRSISAVAVDRTDPRHIYVGTAVARHGSSKVNGGRDTPPGAAKLGVYETSNGGTTWHRTLTRPGDGSNRSSGTDYFRGGISKLSFDPDNPHTIYASMFDYGLFRRVGSRPWRQIYTIKTPGAAATSITNRVEFALAPRSRHRTRIYLGDSTYFDNSTAALLRTNGGRRAKPHWKLLSSPKPGRPGYGSYNFCQTQCSYDMVVMSPPGRPNLVYLSGSMNYDELAAFGGPGDSNGRAVVRSADGGHHFTDMTNDARRHATGLHPDHHALVFAPHRHGFLFFTASDGGIVRQRGPFVSRSKQCKQRGLSGVELADCRAFLSRIPSKNTTLNAGLASLQYQSVTVAPSGALQGGTQDNGTWERNPGGRWAETIGGDGGQSGFNVANPKIRYHSYYLPQHDVSFDAGSPTGWDWISDPLLASGESASFYTPFVADPSVAGTVFDGLQHIWRTTDNGGKRGYLQKYCNELTGAYSPKHPCGDWVTLGGKKGDLSGAAWGKSDASPNNYVVSIARTPQDRNVMWAATRYGRLFVSSNANTAKPASVVYNRLDRRLHLPKRFVSGIAIDPKHPYHVYLSYSGYSAYSPGGHVFSVHWDPKTKTGTVRKLSSNLGDQPVTDVVYAPHRHALFIGTDFGVLTRRLNRRDWVATRGLPMVAVYGLTLNPKRHTLLAATHGRSIWRLPLH